MEGTDHVDVAMGKVDHPDDAVNHRVANGDQAVDRAKSKSVDELLDEECHRPPSPEITDRCDLKACGKPSANAATMRRGSFGSSPRAWLPAPSAALTRSTIRT